MVVHTKLQNVEGANILFGSASAGRSGSGTHDDSSSTLGAGWHIANGGTITIEPTGNGQSKMVVTNAQGKIVHEELNHGGLA